MQVPTAGGDRKSKSKSQDTGPFDLRLAVAEAERHTKILKQQFSRWRTGLGRPDYRTRRFTLRFARRRRTLAKTSFAHQAGRAGAKDFERTRQLATQHGRIDRCPLEPGHFHQLRKPHDAALRFVGVGHAVALRRAAPNVARTCVFTAQAIATSRTISKRTTLAYFLSARPR